MIVWLTGKSGSGKTTIASTCRNYCPSKIFHLDSDLVRLGLNNLEFTDDSHDESIIRLAHVANHMVESGCNTVIVSSVSPSAYSRRKAYEICNFYEVYIECSTEKLIKRDLRGPYSAASEGKFGGLSRFNSQYDVPINPDLTIDTTNENSTKSSYSLFTFINHENKTNSNSN